MNSKQEAYEEICRVIDDFEDSRANEDASDDCELFLAILQMYRTLINLRDSWDMLR